MEGRKDRTHYVNFGVWEHSYELLQAIRRQTHISQVELFDTAMKDLAAKYRVDVGPESARKDQP